MTDSNLKPALDYLDEGWSIIPIHTIKEGRCTCGHSTCGKPGKHPRLTSWTEYQTRKSTPEEVKSWFEEWPDSNIAVVTGKISNLVVIDIDDIKVYKRIYNLSPTSRFSTTGRGGKHLFYSYPEGIDRVPNSVSKIMPEVDSRGDGGYIILPPSNHISGRSYKWNQFKKVETISEDVLDIILDRVKEDPFANSFTGSTKNRALIADKNDVKRALTYLKADNYDQWLKVGMALKLEYGNEGYPFWDEWSQASIKYNPSESIEKWKSFKRTEGITIATIFYLASEQGFVQHEIPPPIPLIPVREAAKPFPLDALGPILGGVAKRVHEVVQAPTAICGQSILAAEALAVQSYANVTIDGRTILSSLFLLTVADSGERKTAVDKLIIDPILKHQKKRLENFKEKMDIYEKDHSDWEKQKGKKLNTTATAVKFSIEKEPKPPIYPIIIVDEPTYEGLISEFGKGLYSMGIFSDEGGRLFGGYGMKKESKLNFISSLSNLWDGKPISRVRVSSPPLVLYNCYLSVHLMIQNIIAEKVLYDSTMMEQGFFPRFLISWPESTIGTRTYNETNLKNDPLMKVFEKKMGQILKKTYPVSMLEGKPPKSPLGTLSLCLEAKQRYIAFHEFIESQQAMGGPYSSIKPFASKASEQALRIATVLTLFDDLEAKVITEPVMASAIALAQYYLDEALRITERTRIAPELRSAQKLLDWLVKEGKTTVELKTVYQWGPNSLRTRDAALKALKILENYYWLQPVGTNRWNVRLC